MKITVQELVDNYNKQELYLIDAKGNKFSMATHVTYCDSIVPSLDICFVVEENGDFGSLFNLSREGTIVCFSRQKTLNYKKVPLEEFVKENRDKVYLRVFILKRQPSVNLHREWKEIQDFRLSENGIVIDKSQITEIVPEDISDISRFIGTWSKSNFEKRENHLLIENSIDPSFRALFPLLGVGEELLGELMEELKLENIYLYIGKFLHACLKYQQGIRGVTAKDVLDAWLSLTNYGDNMLHGMEGVSVERFSNALSSFVHGKNLPLNFDTPKIKDAYADGLVFFLDGCQRAGVDIVPELRATLSEVLTRNWNDKRNTVKISKEWKGRGLRNVVVVYGSDNRDFIAFNSEKRFLSKSPYNWLTMPEKDFVIPFTEQEKSNREIREVSYNEVDLIIYMTTYRENKEYESYII